MSCRMDQGSIQQYSYCKCVIFELLRGRGLEASEDAAQLKPFERTRISRLISIQALFRNSLFLT